MTDTHIKIKPVTPRVQYTANGSTTVFPYSFAIFDESDMVVYVDDEIIESGYSVSGAGQTDGGNVTFDTAPEDGKIITLLRNVPIERMTDFQEGGTFRPKNLNDEFDRQAAFAQQVQEALTRCVKVDPTSSTNPEDILPKVEELYDDIANIDAVANDLTNIDAVASNQTNIDAVAGNETNINEVAGVSSDVATVAGISSNVSSVASNATNINTCASNISAISDASTQAANAASSADSAAASAQAAAISAAGTHFKLFHHDWFDYELNDMAWLRADTFSWQDGTVYSNAYQHLASDIESSKKMFYGWISGNPLDLSNYYTLSATPSVGDAIYSVENNTSADSLTTIASISGTTIVGANGVSYFSNAPETRELYLLSKDTIGAFDVYYYLASDGHKIVAALNEEDVSDVYDEFGVAWYYILDTTNQRFKLPRENPAREVLGQSAPVIGNGTQPIGLSGINGNTRTGVLGTASANTGIVYTTDGPLGTEAAKNMAGAYGLSTDLTKSGMIADLSETTGVFKGKKYLYFYVGQFSQSATEQTAGLNAELFNEKADINLNNAAPNASSTAKEIIVSWREPDYSSGTSVSLNNTFTPTKDGVIEYKVYCGTGTTASFWIIEDELTGRKLSGLTNAASGYIHQGGQLSVVKNKTYYVESKGTVEYINFFPYKGA